MAHTAATNWGLLKTRFQKSVQSRAAIIPVNMDTGAFQDGGYDPFNAGAVFDADSFYLIGYGTGDKSVKKSYAETDTKDETENTIISAQKLTGMEYGLKVLQDPEPFVDRNRNQRFCLVVKEAEREDGLFKFRVMPIVTFKGAEFSIPGGVKHVEYDLTAKAENNASAIAVQYRLLADVFAGDLLVAANSGRELNWNPEFGTAVKLADIGVTGTATWDAAAVTTVLTIHAEERTGIVYGKFTADA